MSTDQIGIHNPRYNVGYLDLCGSKTGRLFAVDFLHDDPSNAQLKNTRPLDGLDCVHGDSVAWASGTYFRINKRPLLLLVVI